MPKRSLLSRSVCWVKNLVSLVEEVEVDSDSDTAEDSAAVAEVAREWKKVDENERVEVKCSILILKVAVVATDSDFEFAVVSPIRVDASSIVDCRNIRAPSDSLAQGPVGTRCYALISQVL